MGGRQSKESKIQHSLDYSFFTSSWLTQRDTSRLVGIFRIMDGDRDGMICSRDFFHYTGLRNTLLNERLFFLLDSDHKKFISFQEFFKGLVQLCTLDDLTLTQVSDCI